MCVVLPPYLFKVLVCVHFLLLLFVCVFSKERMIERIHEVERVRRWEELGESWGNVP